MIMNLLFMALGRLGDNIYYHFAKEGPAIVGYLPYAILAKVHVCFSRPPLPGSQGLSRWMGETRWLAGRAGQLLSRMLRLVGRCSLDS